MISADVGEHKRRPDRDFGSFTGPSEGLNELWFKACMRLTQRIVSVTRKFMAELWSTPSSLCPASLPAKNLSPEAPMQ